VDLGEMAGNSGSNFNAASKVTKLKASNKKVMKAAEDTMTDAETKQFEAAIEKQEPVEEKRAESKKKEEGADE
jgi:hypothetical protein